MTAHQTENRAKVFVSYSRADSAFADDLVAALMACGFEAYIDREDIAPGEAWEDRLGNLIAEADTVVYVISPESIASQRCSWEVAETLRLSKRLLPLMWRPVPDEQIPEDLARLNFTFFSGDKTFAQGLADLAEALRTDVGWIREHSRIGAAARRWDARGRPQSSLLRGEDLDAARDWSASRPANAPDLTDLHRDFITEALALREATELAARNRRRGIVFASSSVALVMTGIAGFAALQWRDANESRDFARGAYEELVATNDELLTTYLRLNADIGLRVPATGNKALSIDAGWFPLAANSSGAVARVERLREDGTPYMITSGFVIDGAMVSQEFAGQPLLLAPNISTTLDEGSDSPFAGAPVDALDEEFWDSSEPPPAMARSLPVPATREDPSAVPATAPSGGRGRPVPRPGIEDDPFAVPDEAPMMAQTRIDQAEPPASGGPMRVSFPAVDAEAYLEADKRIWATAEYLSAPPFHLWSLKGDLPFGAKSLTVGAIDCGVYQAANYSDGAKMDWIAMYGIGNDVDRSDGALTLFLSEAGDFSNPYQLEYSHSTTLGSAGAPVFDLDTGKIIAVHFGSSPGANGPGQRTGWGISLPLLINEIRMEGDYEPTEGEEYLLCETGS